MSNEKCVDRKTSVYVSKYKNVIIALNTVMVLVLVYNGEYDNVLLLEAHKLEIT